MQLVSGNTRHLVDQMIQQVLESQDEDEDFNKSWVIDVVDRQIVLTFADDLIESFQRQAIRYFVYERLRYQIRNHKRQYRDKRRRGKEDSLREYVQVPTGTHNVYSTKVRTELTLQDVEVMRTYYRKQRAAIDRELRWYDDASAALMLAVNMGHERVDASVIIEPIGENGG